MLSVPDRIVMTGPTVPEKMNLVTDVNEQNNKSSSVFLTRAD